MRGRSKRGAWIWFASSVVAALLGLVITFVFATRNRAPEPLPDGTSQQRQGGYYSPQTGGSIRDVLTPKAPEITKRDCERLVSGQLLFEPIRTMRQGQPYMVFARLTRTPGVDIAKGLEGSEFIIVQETVSCKVSVSLDSQEPGAFAVDKVPDGRKDEQVLEPNSFSQWDWRVTPKKHGELHLLLYVTPMLYVDGIGEQLKQFQQPPRVITVSPDYLYESKAFIKDNWTILGGLLTAVFIPLFLWFRQGIVAWFNARFQKKASSHL